MAGSEEINRVGIEVYIDDKTTGGLEQISGKIESDLEDVGKSIDDNLGEATRTVLASTTKTVNTFGNAAVTTSAKVVDLGEKFGNTVEPTNLAGKAISKLGQVFNPFNLAISGVIGGIILLGTKLTEFIEGPLNRAHEALQEDVEKTLELMNQIDEANKRKDLIKLGVTDTEQQIATLLDQRQKSLVDIEKAEAAIIERGKQAWEWEKKYGEESLKRGMGRKTITDEEHNAQLLAQDQYLKAQKASIIAIDAQVAALHRRNAAERSEKGAAEIGPTREMFEKEQNRPTTTRGRKMRVSGGDIDLLSFIPTPAMVAERVDAALMVADAHITQFIANTKERWAQSAIDAVDAQEMAIFRETDMLDASMDKQAEQTNFRVWQEQWTADQFNKTWDGFEEDNAQRAERMLESERWNAQERMRIMEGLGGAALTLANMGGRIAASVAKTEKAKAKAEAVTAVIVASINAALEVARAIASYPDFVGMAAHAAGAAAYIAAAVLAAKYGGGSPQTISAKGAGGGNAGREAYGPPDNGETKSNTIIIQGHVFSPESGADFVNRAMEASEDQRNPGRTRRDVR